jgi:hypothetical protein
MGSGVAKGQAARGVRPLRLSIKACPSAARAVCREAETCPCEGSAAQPLQWPPAFRWDRPERRLPSWSWVRVRSTGARKRSGRPVASWPPTSTDTGALTCVSGDLGVGIPSPIVVVAAKDDNERYLVIDGHKTHELAAPTGRPGSSEPNRGRAIRRVVNVQHRRRIALNNPH